MDECKSPPQEGSVTIQSQNSRLTPLSPVLGSGQGVKKLKSRKRTRNPHKTGVQKLETTLQTQNASLGTLEGEDDSISRPGVSKLESLDNLTKCTQDRIKQLEALKNQRIQTVRELSFHTSKIDDNSLKPTEVLASKPSGVRKPVNLSLHQEQQHQKPWTVKTNPINLPQAVVNIFENENFSDLKEDFQTFTSAALVAPVETLENRPNKTSRAPEQRKVQKVIGNIFENENFNDLNLNADFQSFSSAKALVAPVEIPENRQNKSSGHVQNMFGNENLNDLNLQSFKSARGDMTTVGFEGKQKRNENIFGNENFDDLGDLKSCGFQAASFINAGTAASENFEASEQKSCNFKPSSNQFHSVNNIFKGENFDDLSHFNTLGNSSCQGQQKQLQTSSEGQDLFTGFSYNEQHFSLSLLQKIKSLLTLLDPINIPTKKRKLSESLLTITPIRQTKKRLGCRISPSIQLSEPGLKRARLLFEDLQPCHTSTPLKQPHQSIISLPSVVPSPVKRVFEPQEVILLTEPAEREVDGWLEDLRRERQRLEARLRVVEQRRTILTNQNTMLEFSSKARIFPGVLYKAKATGLRKSLVDITGQNGDVSSVLGEICPQNAHLVHFTVNDRESHLMTKDGAVIVPDSENRVGLAQIEFGFKSLDAVDAHLLPKNWIENHFKWIVWKLASYDRKFGQFDRCLNVENVVQQLKYRYDREIDKAERPILRRILEKDDSSQRRMVLCVSHVVHKANGVYELQLTDGWYPIRTLLDAPLTQQIRKGKIKIGHKLLIYGAELKNCEGCHPLEAPSVVHLQINYNGTRRALWWCKLGAQKSPGPFLLPLTGISLDGGKIGCLRCFIVRVYPLRYLEKSGGTNVWRNQKAQERYSPHGNTSQNLSHIEDPQVLYDMLQNSGDPEGLQEMLSTTQRTALYNYSVTAKKRQSNVTPLLVMKMADAHQNGSDIIHDFRVWRPTECHMDELKEGAVVTVYNVACTPKWGLSAAPSTQFKREPGPAERRFDRFKRKLTEIADLPQFLVKSTWSDEFDTVGLVAQKTVTETDQEVWLADVKQRLLRITINHAPSNILVLDGIGEGQLVTVCNLTFKTHWYSHCQAVGGWSVTFARYSQHGHLREGIERLEEEFRPIDKSKFLQECERKIMAATDMSGTADEMECSQITVTDRALLECMEKLG